MKLLIVKKNEIQEKEVNNLNVEDIGQKAFGLCHVPCAWTLPFLVITKDLFMDIYSDKQQNSRLIVEQYMPNIMLAIDRLGLGDYLIIRSSGVKEGMTERGKYESLESDRINLKYNILKLVNLLLKEPELPESGMPLIIQQYISADIMGHVSNERRFTKESRDFIYEYCIGKNQIETGNISLRNWREKYKIEDYTDKPLVFANDFTEKLKIVCAYFYYQKCRVHIEFVCDKTTFFIVQCDSEGELQGAVDPDKYNIKMFENEDVFHPQILKKITDTDKGKYRKIDNVFIYKEVGIPMPPLYILDDREYIEQLREGEVPEKLKMDLTYMTKQSLVIRTNVISKEKLKSQFSKRSNELRDVDSAIGFLVKASVEITTEGIKDYIFIFHNFIPAKIAAFVNAKPLERAVEIQALWGLPEGLYYNAHDRISVDTKEIDITKMERKKFVISKNEVYKECFIAPDENGKWIVKRLKSQYNWRCTLVDEEMICEIAERARKIVENVGTELSIMWFVGIDKTFYKTNNIPWYHENYDRNSFYYASSANIEMNFKKKYFYEKEILIETRADLKKLKEQDSKEIGLVRIKPKEDDILRSKEFIKDFGELCKQKGANIFLEGAVLAHSFYQLVNTGATVIVAHEMKHYKDKIEFNKLVRDRIPEIIEKNGENALCVVMEGIGLVRQLKNKIIEESYEILSAGSEKEVLEELVDLEEVCMALENKVNLVELDKFDLKQMDKPDKKLLFEGAVLDECKQMISNTRESDFCATLVRKGNNVQLDLLWGNSKREGGNSDSIFYPEDDKKVILGLAFRLFTTSSVSACCKLIYEIRLASLRIQNNLHCTKEEFDKIRNSKKMKKGGFEKGFILLKTDIREEQPENSMFNQILNVKSVYSTNLDLPLKPREDIEVLNSSQLLIRLTIPIYSRDVEWNIKRKKINDFFGEEINIKISKKFYDTKLVFYIKLEKEIYRQLVLEFV